MSWPTWKMYKTVCQEREEAAAEIERLRVQIDAMYEAAATEIERQRKQFAAEASLLRTELQRVLDSYQNPPISSVAREKVNDVKGR